MAGPLDQAMAVEHGVDGACGGDPDIAGEAPDQQLADFPGAPVWLVLFQAHDHGLDRRGQLVGVAHRAARAVAQGLQALFLVAVEDFVAGLSGYPERPAGFAHTLAIKQTGDKSKTFFHDRTLFPRHQHPLRNGEKCYPCVRYDLSPISQVGQRPPSRGFLCLGRCRWNLKPAYIVVTALRRPLDPRTGMSSHAARIDSRICRTIWFRVGGPVWSGGHPLLLEFCQDPFRRDCAPAIG